MFGIIPFAPTIFARREFEGSQKSHHKIYRKMINVFAINIFRINVINFSSDMALCQILMIVNRHSSVLGSCQRTGYGENLNLNLTLHVSENVIGLNARAMSF